MFIRGHLSFTLDGRPFEFANQPISIYGVSGLPWGQLKPETHFGIEVAAAVGIATEEPFIFRTPAWIMREQTVRSQHMGMRFRLAPDIQEKLRLLIEKRGFYPTAYVRKYPRLPADPMIQTFPLRVAARPLNADATQPPLIFDVGNLSPNGILLHTENQTALQLMAGDRVDLVLEPRGWFPMSVQLQGLICRMTDEINIPSGNILRHVGIKFTKVDEANRAAFLDLLKDILTRIKAGESSKK